MALKNEKILDFISSYCNDDTVGLVVVKHTNEDNVQSHLIQDTDHEGSINMNCHELAYYLFGITFDEIHMGEGGWWCDTPEEKRLELTDKVLSYVKQLLHE